MKRQYYLLIIAATTATLVAVVAFVKSKPANIAPPAVIYQNSYDSPEQFLQGIYATDHNLSVEKNIPRIRGVIVSHHLVATESIASAIKMLQGQTFKKILLLSPDHYARCKTLLCTVDGEYETIFGSVRASGDVVKVMAKSPLVTIDPDLFRQEHGIYAVLPYIAHYLPGVSVTPLAISQVLPWKVERPQLLELLKQTVDADTIIVVSSDFSHYLSLDVSNQMDEQTAQTLFAKDLSGIATLKNPEQSDCPNCLWALGALADARGFYNPSVLYHTNSAILLNDKMVPQTTSHFSMVWYENATLNSDDLAVGGDVTLTRTKKLPAIPDVVRTWWSGSGPRFVNLEGPLSKNCTPQSNQWLFCNTDTLWREMKDLATHWSVMNNHMLDRGASGKQETENLLRVAGETPVDEQGVTDGNLRFFALTELMNPVPDGSASRITENENTVLQALRTPQPSNMLTVVLVHGGDEYHVLTTDAQEKRWESYIDAGADAFLVAHSHVVGDVHFYKGKPIFRGIGNFIFDQYGEVPKATAKLVRLRKSGDQILFETLIIPMHQ